jgi:hypothetical protein
MRYCKHEIAGTDSASAQCKLDRIRTASTSDGVTHTDEIGEGRLKNLDLSAEDIGAAFQDTAYGGVDSGPLREIASAGIGLGNLNR